MSFTRGMLGILGFTLALGSAAVAQDHALRVVARGGGYNGLTDLNEAGSADFKKLGYNLGGGLGLQVNRYLTLRGDFTFGRNELRTNSIATGLETNRYFYDAALQLQYPTSSGFEPYIFAGGGGVTVHPVAAAGQDQTKGAGTFGLGLGYQFPRSGFGIFAEGKSWVYKFDRFSGALAGFDKTQFELAWSGGIAYRFRW